MIWSAFSLGLMGSWHCVSMCGPIALMIPKGKSKNSLVPLLLYHFGKVLAYATIGVLMGSLGMFLSSFNFQSILLMITGFLMLIVAFFPIVFNRIERNGFKVFKPLLKVKSQIAKSLKKESIDYAFYIGFLNGFIPCGMVYFAGIGAVAQGNLLDSVLFMVFFGLGTFPFMSILVLVSQFFKQRFVKYAPKLRMAGLILVGVFMVWKGYSNYNQDLSPNDLKSREFSVCY